MINKIIGRNISILYRHEIVYADKKLKDYHLNKIQAEFILHLRHYIGRTHTELNSYFMFNKATITKIIKHLEKYGYVRSVINENDKREKNISITDNGLNIVPTLIQILEEWESRIINQIPEHNIEKLRVVLEQMVENMTKIKEDII